MKTSKMTAMIALLVLGTFVHPVTLRAISVVGSPFTYQGRLIDSGLPADGIYELRFRLYDTATGANAIGPVLTNASVFVTNGLFTSTLDFGPAAFNGDSRWLEIAVRNSGSTKEFAPPPPRQALTASPYSIYAQRVSADGISGIVPEIALSPNIPRLNQSQTFS